MVRNRHTSAVVRQATLPGHCYRETALKHHFPAEWSHQHLCLWEALLIAPGLATRCYHSQSDMSILLQRSQHKDEPSNHCNHDISHCCTDRPNLEVTSLQDNLNYASSRITTFWCSVKSPKQISLRKTQLNVIILADTSKKIISNIKILCCYVFFILLSSITDLWWMSKILFLIARNKAIQSRRDNQQ